MSETIYTKIAIKKPKLGELVLAKTINGYVKECFRVKSKDSKLQWADAVTAFPLNIDVLEWSYIDGEYIDFIKEDHAEQTKVLSLLEEQSEFVLKQSTNG